VVVRNLEAGWDVYAENWPGYNTTEPDQNLRSEMSYDRAGRNIERVVVMDDPDGRIVTRFEYDALGRLTAVVENYRAGVLPDPQINVRTEYGYDARGGRVSLKDGNNHTSVFTYDGLGRLASERDALNHTWSYSYYATGQRMTVTDAEQQATHYHYDGLGRLILEDYLTDPDVSYTYNGLGWRMSMQDGVGETIWTYDRPGRVETVSDPFNGVVQYEYDALGRRTVEVYPEPGLKTVSYIYDLLDRLIGVTDWDSQFTSYRYDVAGNLVWSSGGRRHFHLHLRRAEPPAFAGAQHIRRDAELFRVCLRCGRQPPQRHRAGAPPGRAAGQPVCGWLRERGFLALDGV
jgi:YD repeat-containing protein